MLFALDKEGNKVHIDWTDNKEDYFCPCCGIKMVQRLGDIRIHHFAHPKDSLCYDGWHYDMTDWHFDWQNRFPTEYQEIVKMANGQKHRADILIEEKKVVIEFQHSPLSPEEFEDRNDFYNKLGYVVYWVFDVKDIYDEVNIYNDKKNIWHWKRAKKTFQYYNYKNKNIKIFLQLNNNPIDMIQVTWCTEDEGLSWFATDGFYYDERTLTSFCNKEQKDTKQYYKIASKYDNLIRMNSYKEGWKNITLFFGCPITEKHVASNKYTDHEIYNPSIGFCHGCKYGYAIDDDKKIIKCNKRFSDLNLSGSTLIKEEGKDENGFINRISYFYNGKEVFIDMPTFPMTLGDDIFSIWKKNNCTIAIFRNYKTNKFVKINIDPSEQYKKYKRIFGFLSNDEFNFPGKSLEIFGAYSKEWFLVWCKRNY